MSALRSLRQLSSRVLVSRPVASAARSRLPLLTARTSSLPVSRAFSASAKTLKSGSSDASISAKLQEELQYEREAGFEDNTVPAFLEEFQKQGVWGIEDAAGNDEVALTRQFGNETLRLMFSIADIQNEEPDYEEPEAENENEEGSDETPQLPPIRASLSLTKSSANGALNVDMLCQEGHFIVDNVSFYPDSRIGTELSPEADWKRRGLYIGPQFDTLDVGVQEEFEQFLQERGVNEQLASFIPLYAEHKEQREYVKWLSNVKEFIDL